MRGQLITLLRYSLHCLGLNIVEQLLQLEASQQCQLLKPTTGGSGSNGNNASSMSRSTACCLETRQLTGIRHFMHYNISSTLLVLCNVSMLTTPHTPYHKGFAGYRQCPGLEVTLLDCCVCRSSPAGLLLLDLCPRSSSTSSAQTVQLWPTSDQTCIQCGTGESARILNRVLEEGRLRQGIRAGRVQLLLAAKHRL